MVEVIRAFCWHQKFVPKGLSALASGLYTCIKSFKMCLKSYFKEIVLKLATNGQSDKGFLLKSTFAPKGLSAPALGLYTCIKAFKYIPWAFTERLALCFNTVTILLCYLFRDRWLDFLDTCLRCSTNGPVVSAWKWFWSDFKCGRQSPSLINLLIAFLSDLL